MLDKLGSEAYRSPIKLGVYTGAVVEKVERDSVKAGGHGDTGR